jgi:hypothetical protein
MSAGTAQPVRTREGCCRPSSVLQSLPEGSLSEILAAGGTDGGHGRLVRGFDNRHHLVSQEGERTLLTCHYSVADCNPLL